MGTQYLSQNTATKTQARSQNAIAMSQRSGAGISQTTKYGASTNRQKKSDRNDLALDNDNESTRVKRVSVMTGKVIMRARQEKKLTQKDLATKINEKPNVINLYESGKAVPSSQISNKIQKVLNVYISGKNIGQKIVK